MPHLEKKTQVTAFFFIQFPGDSWAGRSKKFTFYFFSFESATSSVIQMETALRQNAAASKPPAQAKTTHILSLLITLSCYLFIYFFLRGAGDIFTYTAKYTDLSHGNIVGINYNKRYVNCSLGRDSNFNCDLGNKHTILHLLCFSSAEGKSSSIGRGILMSIRKLGSLCWCH